MIDFKGIAAYLSVVLLILGLGFACYEWGASNASEDQAMKDRENLIIYAEDITKRIEQHDRDQITINNLSRKLDGMQHIPITSCEQARNSNTESGIFFRQLDTAFGKLQEGVRLLITRCDQLNIDAISINGGK